MTVDGTPDAYALTAKEEEEYIILTHGPQLERPIHRGATLRNKLPT